ncbi:MAG: hypothetical protein ACOYLK_12845 [Sphingomonas sp.]
MDVEFRLRVTSMRLLAIALGLDEAALVASVTLKDDDALPAALDFAHPDLDIQAAYGQAAYGQAAYGQAAYGVALSDAAKAAFCGAWRSDPRQAGLVARHRLRLRR